VRAFEILVVVAAANAWEVAPHAGHIQLPAEGGELVMLEELWQDLLNELSGSQHQCR